MTHISTSNREKMHQLLDACIDKALTNQEVSMTFTGGEDFANIHVYMKENNKDLHYTMYLPTPNSVVHYYNDKPFDIKFA